MEARLRQALLGRRIVSGMGTPQAILHVATRKGILRQPTLGVVEQLKRHWLVAVMSPSPCPARRRTSR